jgi:hypothetical protein
VEPDLRRHRATPILRPLRKLDELEAQGGRVVPHALVPAEHQYLLDLAALVDEYSGRQVERVQGADVHGEHVAGAGQHCRGEGHDVHLVEELEDVVKDGRRTTCAEQRPPELHLRQRRGVEPPAGPCAFQGCVGVCLLLEVARAMALVSR